MPRLRRAALAAAAIASAGALYWGRSAVIGAAAGGALAVVNFEAMGALVRGLTGERPGSLSWLGVLGVLLRYILLCLALFVIIGVWHANVLALAAGFTAPLAAVVVASTIAANRESKAEREIESVNDNAEA